MYFFNDRESFVSDLTHWLLNWAVVAYLDTVVFKAFPSLVCKISWNHTKLFAEQTLK